MNPLQATNLFTTFHTQIQLVCFASIYSVHTHARPMSPVLHYIIATLWLQKKKTPTHCATLLMGTSASYV